VYLSDTLNSDDAPEGGPQQGPTGWTRPTNSLPLPGASVPLGLVPAQRPNLGPLLDYFSPENLAKFAIRASPLGSVSDAVRYQRQSQQAADEGRWGDAWLNTGKSLVAATDLVPFAISGAAADALALARSGEVGWDRSTLGLGTRATAGAGKAALAAAGAAPQGESTVATRSPSRLRRATPTKCPTVEPISADASGRPVENPGGAHRDGSLDGFHPVGASALALEMPRCAVHSMRPEQARRTGDGSMWHYLVDLFLRRPWQVRVWYIFLLVCMASIIAFSPVEVGSPFWKLYHALFAPLDYHKSQN
jgi:hypothetical protein